MGGEAIGACVVGRNAELKLKVSAAVASSAAAPRWSQELLPIVERRSMWVFIVFLLMCQVNSSWQHYTTNTLYSGGRLGYNKGAKNDPKNDPNFGAIDREIG